MNWPVLTSLIIVCDTFAVIIKTRCPRTETHKSCLYFRESLCWTSSDMLSRNLQRHIRFERCFSACVCKKGSVRAYPEGPCVPAASCRGRKLIDMIGRLPVEWRGSPLL